MKINSLYRYPIKSFTGEKKESVEINDLGKIIGDRIGAFRLGEDRGNYDKWQKKTNYLSLMHVPYLALIKIKFDENLEKISLNCFSKLNLLRNFKIIFSICSFSEICIFTSL